MENINSKRFIAAYNTTDYALRSQYGLGQGMSFSTVIRKCVSLNSVVRKYEDVLIDYGRLRNAIIHRSIKDQVIAEPHTDVVVDFERLTSLIVIPPKVLDTFREKAVTSVESTLSIKSVIEIISKTGFSNIPVYRKGEIIGVANGQRLINRIGKIISRGLNVNTFITNTKIGNVLFSKEKVPYYLVKDMSLTIEQAMHQFYINRKLLIILITKTGNYKELPIGIVSVADVMDMNKILDNY